MMSDKINPSPDQPSGDDKAAQDRRRLELEAALDRTSQPGEESRRILFALHTAGFDDDWAPSEEELLEERKTSVEISISELISEFEAESGAAKP